MSELDFSQTAEDNLDLLFYDDIYVSGIFCKFETSATPN